MAAVFIATAALGATLDELNIARDPENLDGVIYGTAVYNLNFRAGPGDHFAAIGTVPAGTEVPVIGWISDYLRDGEFWIRTEYGGERGWLCPFKDGERLIEKDGGPLFPMEVAVDGLLFEHATLMDESWLKKGDKLEFASLWGESWLEADADHIDFWVRHGGEWGHLCAYATEDFVEERYKPLVKGVSGENASGWFVDFPPEFLGLNFDYNYESFDFGFVVDAAYPKYYLGPGFEYAETDSVFWHAGAFFVEEPWALVLSRNDWSWVYFGTEEKPNVQLTADVRFKECDKFPKLKTVALEDVFSGFEEGDGKWVDLYYDIWPSSNVLYIRFGEPYFSLYIGKVTVKYVDVYQPPERDTPIFSGPPAAEIEGGWHETIQLTYPVELPDGFDFAAPFKMDVEMVYDGAEEFTLSFDCNRP